MTPRDNRSSNRRPQTHLRAWRRAILACCGLWIAVGATTHAAVDSKTAKPPAFKMAVVSFASDPPGNVRQAPGGGRILTPAAVFTPVAGDNPYGPAIVMIDQGPGSHPLEQGQASRFAAERMAALGYTVMSVYAGQERGFALTPFADTAYAIKGALDYLEVMGTRTSCCSDRAMARSSRPTISRPSPTCCSTTAETNG